MNKINLSAVSYLNTKPFIFGIQHSPVIDQINLSLDNPADCAKKLIQKTVDIGLIPVVAIAEIQSAEIISDFCIGTVGAVGSVLLVSEVPLSKIKSIFLDYQSRTSVELLQVLIDQFWKINVTLLPSSKGFESEISGLTAGLIIGDRALQVKNKYNYIYDLGLAWYEFTQLPFVFACWVRNKKINDLFIKQFNQALSSGVSEIDSLIAQNPELIATFPNVAEYLKSQIHYHFDPQMKKGLNLFLQFLKEKK
jgi:chorismate dehydratase